jgi:hypothetical protein
LILLAPLLFARAGDFLWRSRLWKRGSYLFRTARGLGATEVPSVTEFSLFIYPGSGHFIRLDSVLLPVFN